jgi:hypothetical protein
MHLEHLWSSYILTKDVKNFMKTTKLLRIGQKQRGKPFSKGSLKSLPNIFGNDSVPISSTKVP